MTEFKIRDLMTDLFLAHPGCGFEGGPFQKDSGLMARIQKQAPRPFGPATSEYLQSCVPAEDVDPGLANFLGTHNLLRGNLFGLPGQQIIGFGFIVFAEAGDGASYIIDTSDESVYHLPVGCVQLNGVQSFKWEVGVRYKDTSPATIRAASTQHWESVREFLAWLSQELA